MTGNYGDNHPVLIMPEEVVEIAKDYITIESASRAAAVMAVWKKRVPQSWPKCWGLGVIYEAGRIQGIREERTKKAEHGRGKGITGDQRQRR